MPESIVLAIDPGPEKSAWVRYASGRVLGKGWWLNHELVDALHAGDFRADAVVIEMIASFGMPVGREVFETCTWIGKFEWAARRSYGKTHRLFRTEVKSHLCNSVKAKDANVRQALIDRFGPGKDKAIGRKASPGPLYGISGDVWAALAVAVTWADKTKESQ